MINDHQVMDSIAQLRIVMLNAPGVVKLGLGTTDRCWTLGLHMINDHQVMDSIAQLRIVTLNAPRVGNIGLALLTMLLSVYLTSI